MTIVLDPGDALSGTLAVDGGEADVRFAGWIELMAAVNAARSARSTAPVANEAGPLPA